MAKQWSVRRFVDQKLAQMDRSKVGLTNIAQHSIYVHKNAIPYRQKSYIENPEMERILYDKIDYLIDRDYIRKGCGDSEWLSRACMVKSKDGDLVFHVGYRELNSCILEYNYPVHSQWKILQKLKNARIISIIKIPEAYHHIKVDYESRKYTAFHIPGRGVFEWVRMPYGLKGGPATYSFVTDQIKMSVFDRLKSSHHNIQGEDKIFVCLETWIVISQTYKEHEILLDCLLDILYESGLEIDREQSQFAKNRINYFGFTIDDNGLHVCQEAIKPIIDYPRPKNIHEVKQFNSMVHHYRNHLQDIAMIQEPLNKFCAPNAVWKWTEEEETAFRKTKQALSNASSLLMIDPKLPFRLFTYINHKGHGANLTQYNKRKYRENLITNVSKSFNETEKTYPTIDKYVLSIVSALSEVKDLIKGCECEIFTYHSVVSWYKNKERVSRRLDGWATALSKYNITLTSYWDMDIGIDIFPH